MEEEEDAPDLVSDEVGYEGLQVTPAMSSGLARRREAILKKKEASEKAGDDEEAMLKRRTEHNATREAAARAEASLASVTDRSHHLFEDVGRSYIPAELNTRGGYAPTPTVETKTYTLLAAADEEIFKLLCQISKLTITSVCKQESSLKKPVDLEFECRVLPIMGCVLAKRAPAAEFRYAVQSMKEKLNIIDKSGSVEQMRAQFLGTAAVAKPTKSQVKDMARRVHVINTVKGMDQYPWEWTIQLGGGFGQLRIGEGKGELMPIYTHQSILLDGEEDIEVDDEETGSVATAITADHSSITDADGLFGNDIDAEKEEGSDNDEDDDDDDDDGSDAEPRASSPSADAKHQNQTVSKPNAVTADDDASVGTKGSRQRGGNLAGNESSIAVSDDLKKSVRIQRGDEDEDSDSEEDIIAASEDVDNEIDKSKTLDINAMLLARWRRSETMAAALSNMRRITWMNMTGWVVQLLQTLQWMHSHYSCVGHYTVNEVVLLPDMAVAVSAKSAVTRLQYTYSQQNTVWMSKIQRARYTRQQRRLIKGLFARHAWIDSKPWLEHCQVDASSLRPETAAAISETFDVDAPRSPSRGSNSLFAREGSRTGTPNRGLGLAASREGSPAPLLPSQIAATSRRRSNTFGSYDDADEKTVNDNNDNSTVGDGSPTGLGAAAASAGANGTYGGWSAWDPRLSHKTVVFPNLEFLDPKLVGKVIVEKDAAGNEPRTKAREDQVLAEMKRFLAGVVKDYKCLGIIIMQMLLRRPLDNFENKRVFSSQFGIANVPELIDVSSYGKAGEQARDLCALMEMCFRSSNVINIEPARKKGFLAGKYYSLELPKLMFEFLKRMDEVVEMEKENHGWVKKTGFKRRDKLQLRRQVEAKQNYYARHKATGPDTAASRLLEDRKKLWFELLSPDQQAKIKRKQRLREVSEEHRLERIAAMHQATFHHWSENEFRHWCHEAVLQYLRRAWAIRRPTLSNKSIRLSEIEKESVGEALGPVEFQKYSLVKRLLQHHGSASGIQNAELRGVKPTNFEIDSDMEKMFFLMGRDLSNVLGDETTSMECSVYFEQAMELSRSKLEKTGLAASLSGPAFQHKQLQFECDFFIKIFADFQGFWDAYLDSLGYGEQVMDKKEMSGATEDMIDEMVKYNKTREVAIVRISRCVTYAMLEKYHGNHWQRQIGVDIAASRMIAGYRRMKVMKIMNRVWRKVLDEHGDILVEEEEARKKFLLETPQKEVFVLAKPIERINEILKHPQIHSVKCAIAPPDLNGNGATKPVEGSLEVTVSFQLRQTHFGDYTPSRMKDVTCLAAIVMQPPHLPPVDAVPFDENTAAATDKQSLRELAAKRKRQQMLYEGEVVVIMHDNRDLYKWLTLQMADRVFNACRESAEKRRESLLREVSNAHLLPHEDMLPLPMPRISKHIMCPASTIKVTVPPPLPKKRGKLESGEASTEAAPVEGLNPYLASVNAQTEALNKLSVELCKQDPNYITVRIGGLLGFSRYRVRVLCSQLMTPVQPQRRNSSAWMTRFMSMPVSCCFPDTDTAMLTAAYDAREEELKEKGKKRADAGAGPANELENIIDIADNIFLEMNWTLPGQTSTAKPQPPRSLVAQTVSSTIDTSVAGGSARFNHDDKLRIAAEDDSEEEEMEWGSAATLRERVQRLPKVKDCTHLHHVVALTFKPSLLTGGEPLTSFRLSRSMSVEVQTNSTAGLFPLGAASEYEGEGKEGGDVMTKKPRVWENRGKWNTLKMMDANDSAIAGAHDSRETQDRVSATDLLTFLKGAVDLPEGLVDPATGKIDHWWYNPLPSLEGFERKVALEHAHFVINVQYRIAAINKHGMSKWMYSVDCPICTVVPDKKAVLKNPVVALSKPYIDTSSFAQRNLLRFREFTIANMRDYSELIVKPIEVSAGGGIGLILGKGDSRPTTRGTTAPDTRGTTTAASFQTNFGKDLDGNNSTIASHGVGGDESLASLDNDEDPFLDRRHGVLFEPPVEEDEEMAWLMKLNAAKPVIAEIKRGPQ